MNGVLDGALDQLNVATHRYLKKNAKIFNGIFQNDPLLKFIQKNCIEPFPGGRVIAENVEFDTLIGGGYGIGQDFDLSEKKTTEQVQFTPKFLEVNVTMTLEEIEVLNNGPAMIFRTLDNKMRNAYNSIGSHLAIALYLRNSAAGWSKMITGLAEAVNDGTNNSWDGASYANYGGIARSTMNGSLSAKNTNLNGEPIEYSHLEDSLSEASDGEGEMEPNIGITTPRGMTSMKVRFQTQQTLNEREPVLGFRGLGVGNATLMKSRLAPGSDIAGQVGNGSSTAQATRANRVALNFLRFTTGNPAVTYPLSNGGTETLTWINARREALRLYVATSKLFSFGFSGFKFTAGNSKVSGQVHWSGELVINPIRHSGLYNFI